MHHHTRKVCAEHGCTLVQCRCPAPKKAVPVPCPGEGRCSGASQVQEAVAP